MLRAIVQCFEHASSDDRSSHSFERASSDDRQIESGRVPGFAVRLLVDAAGRGDVFATHCEGDALLDAAVAALGAPDTVESLSGVQVDGGSSGLDSALRVVELCSLRAAERSLHGSKADGDAAIRRRALDCLARVPGVRASGGSAGALRKTRGPARPPRAGAC